MPFICIAIDFIDLLSKSAAEDLALGGGTGSLCLVGIDVHGGSAVLVHTNHYIIEDQLAALAAAGHANNLAVLNAHLFRIALQHMQVTLGDNDALLQLHLHRSPAHAGDAWR